MFSVGFLSLCRILLLIGILVFLLVSILIILFELILLQVIIIEISGFSGLCLALDIDLKACQSRCQPCVLAFFPIARES